MITLKPLANSPEQALQKAGWNWMLGADTVPYLVQQVVQVKEEDAENFHEAAETLYSMFIDAGQHVIDKLLFKEMGIPESLIELIRHTWEDDRHSHLYGRFDLSGGISGQPIKLIEFNADTATCLPETGVVQWAQLKANGLDEEKQFNTLFETLVAQFTHLRNVNPDLTPSLLLSTMRDYPEDDTNVAILQEAAREAGFDTAFAYVDEVEFSKDQGIFLHQSNPGQFGQGNFVRYDFWFKLLPWEYIGNDEPELADILTHLVVNRKVVILNPAYTLLFQSKYILKILWDLFPYHPLLLQTERHRLGFKKSVSKVLFGREGANVSVIERDGTITEQAAGDYASQPVVYQEFTPFLQDNTGLHYQAGVFYAGTPCALGFRMGGLILDNTAQFIGHVIE